MHQSDVRPSARQSGSPPRAVRSTVRAALSVLLLLVMGAWASARAETLTVALYPWVPRVDQFEYAIRVAWKQVNPNVPLTFIKDFNTWDGGYSTEPPKQADVFIFDAMYLEDFRARGLLTAMDPAEIKDASDFLDYARKAVIADGKYWAVPQLGCANILFYRKDDAAIANANTLGQLNAALKQCTYTSEIPPDRRGFMVDMNGGTTNATLYLDIAHSVNGLYPLPEPAKPDPAYIADQRIMLAMASYWNAKSEDETPYARARWFDQGYGRAFMGFSELMSVMSPATLANIGLKVMPLSDTIGHQKLFYVDAVGVNPATVARGTRALAVQLANTIAATETIWHSFRQPKPGEGNPQYLMSVRNSAFQKLAAAYPIYQRMYELARTSDPVAFKLDASGRNWVKAIKGEIIAQSVAHYSCGCDQKAPRPIGNNADAKAVCPLACEASGGWNGNWTNAPPAPGFVCGCNACPVN